MMNSISFGKIINSAVFCAVLCVFAPAYAQECSINKEAIVKLRKPAVGSYNVWDTIHGEVESVERYVSAFEMESGNVMVAGEYESPLPDSKRQLFLSEIGRNGRVMWEKKHSISGLENVVKILPRESGVLVLATVQRGKALRSVWIGFFNGRGDLLSEKSIKGGRADFTPEDIVFYPERKSYVLAVRSEIPNGGKPGNARLYRLNSTGQVISGNEFVIGADNVLNGLYVLGDGDIMGVGTIQDAKGRKTGWVVRLNKDLRIKWQQSYPRGAGAILQDGKTLKKNLFVVGGTALPAGEGGRAGWLMVIDDTIGTILWQRYFTGGLHFDGRSVLANDDGMISFMMDGAEIDGMEKIDEQENEHVRLLTLNPRGVMFSSDEFFQGSGVDAFQMVDGADRTRLIVGETRIDHRIEALEGEVQEEPEIKRSPEAWLIAAPSAEPYEDPCVPIERTIDD